MDLPVGTLGELSVNEYYRPAQQRVRAVPLGRTKWREKMAERILQEDLP